ncbi:hypothetical protein RchiOBHm_Chr7g0214471 [Rosa chinensis]|uniref:Uncharacterized protein n=1 Tax=Rosa chinensis TaxID=74649 RepID=A0A2P6PB89_ROSCH|nr:hypothetical protein RchiOBHm_Chr7g0214471 [Rosa chinensis]
MSYILYMACIVKVIDLQEVFDEEEVIVPELNQKDDSSYVAVEICGLLLMVYQRLLKVMIEDIGKQIK